MSKTANSTANFGATRQSGPVLGGDLDFVAQLARAPSAVFGTLLTWQVRANQRSRLAEMESHRLEDMGISPAEARREAAKPFWRA
jgi:uncharacterized protein YjiS (DUF1127 family)